MNFGWFIKIKVRKVKQYIAGFVINIDPKSRDKRNVCNKILLSLTGQRYIIRHKANGSRIDVSIYDLERQRYINADYTNVYNQKPRWWTHDMCGESSIIVRSPSTQERENGMTFTTKVEDAYNKLQILVNHLNDEDRIDKSEIEAAKLTAEQTHNDLKSTTKKNFQFRKV
jgi:hypothetical protein